MWTPETLRGAVTILSGYRWGLVLVFHSLGPGRDDRGHDDAAAMFLRELENELRAMRCPERLLIGGTDMRCLREDGDDLLVAVTEDQLTWPTVNRIYEIIDELTRVAVERRSAAERLGEAIHKRREALGKSIRDLARETTGSEQRIRDIEGGRDILSDESLEQFAAALQCTPATLRAGRA